MSSDEPNTSDEAASLTKLARIRALADVLERHDVEDRRMIATELYSAWLAVEVVLPDDCGDVDPKFGRCVQEYGHEPFVTRQTTVRTPEDLAKLTNPQPLPHMGDGWVSYEDHRYGGHYTTEHADERRPDGSHPWDY